MFIIILVTAVVILLSSLYLMQCWSRKRKRGRKGYNCSQEEFKSYLSHIDPPKILRLAQLLNFSTKTVFEIERKAQEAVPWFPSYCYLAYCLQKESVSALELAKAAYLIGERRAAFNLLKFCGLVQAGDNADHLDRIMFDEIWRDLPTHLSGVKHSTLDKIVRLSCPYGTNWSDIFQKLQIKDGAGTAEETCQNLYSWSKTAPGSFQQLLRTFCNVGHSSAAQELLSDSMAISKKFLFWTVLSQRKTRCVDLAVPLKESQISQTKLNKLKTVQPSRLVQAEAESNRGRFFDVPPEVELQGRETELQKVLNDLQANGIVTIGGMAGIGKTSLAIKLVHKIHNKYDFVWYITCSNENNFQQSICKMGQNHPWLESAAGRPGEYHFLESFVCCKKWVYSVGERSRILLVFDGHNVSHSSTKKYTVDRFLDENLPSGVHCIFTTQKRLERVGCINVGHHFQELQGLPKNTVEGMLLKQISNVNEENSEAARKIAKATEGIPLLIDLVTAFINKEGVTFPMYLDWIEKKRDLVLSDEGEARRNLAYEVCIEEGLSNDEEKELLIVLAVSDAPNPVPIQLFTLGADGLDDSSVLGKRLKPAFLTRSFRRQNSGSRDFVPREFFKLLSNLKRSHLIGFENAADPTTEQISGIVMHAEIAKHVARVFPTSYGKLILAKLLQAAFYKFRTNMMSVYEALLPHAAKLIGPDPKTNLKELDPYFLINVGRMNSILGHFIDGKKILRAALERAREDDLLASSFHALTLHYLGEVERRHGNLNEARKLISTSIELWKSRIEFCEGSHTKEQQERNLALAQIAYAEVYLDAGEYEKTVEYLTESKALKRFELSSSDHQSDSWDFGRPASFQQYVHDRGSIYGTVGRAYHGLQEYDKAINHFTSGLIILESHEYRVDLLNAHVCVSTARKRHSDNKEDEFHEAYEHCLVALEKVQNRYGSQHRFTAWMQREMARLECDEAFYRRDAVSTCIHHVRHAAKLAETSLNVHIELLSSNHQKIAKVCYVIGDICLRLAEVDRTSKEQACVCAKLAFDQAIRITQRLKDEKFAVDHFLRLLKKKSEKLSSELPSRVEHARIREGYDAKNSESKSVFLQLKSDSSEDPLKSLRITLETIAIDN